MIPLYPFKDRKEKIRLYSHYEFVETIFNLSFLVEDFHNEIQDFYPLINHEVSGKIFPQENLWQSTCFEIFFKNLNGKDYYEFNFNSQGDWNLFYFSDYRERVATVADPVDVKIVVEKNGTKNFMKFKFDLKKLSKLRLPCHVNITSVIKSNSEISYWSQKHNAVKPDFHDANNFSLILTEDKKS